MAGAEGIGVEHDMGWWDSVGTVKVVVCDVETVAVGAGALASAKVVDTMVVRSVVVRGAGRTHAAGAAGDVSFDAEQDVLVVVFEGAGADGCFPAQCRLDPLLPGFLLGGLLFGGGVGGGFGGGSWGGWGLGSSRRGGGRLASRPAA